MSLFALSKNKHTPLPGAATLGALTVLSLLLSPGLSRAMGAVWVASSGGGTPDLAEATARDPATGESYVVGSFTGAASFSGIVLTSAGAEDVFVAKYDATGAILYAFSFGGAGIDLAHDVALDPAGDVYVTGSYDSPVIDFGLGAVPNFGAGTSDAYLAKYDPFGAPIYAFHVGGPANDESFSVAVDGAASPVIVGEFAGAADFGTGALVSAGFTDCFFAKYDPAGAPLWSFRAGAGGTDAARGVAIDGLGDVVATGEFEAAVNFGTGALASFGFHDVFVAKYDPGAVPIWSLHAGGTLDDRGHGVDTDSFNAVVVAGEFEGGAAFGTGPLFSAGMDDGFVAKWDAGGLPLWSSGFGGAGPDFAFDVGVGPTDAVIAVGAFSAGATFGTKFLASLGGFDAFHYHLDPGGVDLLVGQCGGAADDFGLGVTAMKPLELIVAGHYASAPADFGGIFTAAVGAMDAYVAHLDMATGVDAPVVAASGAERGLRNLGSNPLRGAARLEFSVPQTGAPVRLDVFDVVGRRVRTLFDGPAPADRGRVSWDGRDSAGRTVAAGVYLVRLAGAGVRETQSLTVLR